MDRTSTKWWVRLEQGRSHNRVLQSLKPRQATPAQDRDQERLRLPRSNLRHSILLRIHSLLCNDIEQTTVQQTTLATLLQ